MSQDWNDSNAYRNPDERFEAGPPEKKGMSGGMKILLILLAVAGVCLVLCCGVGFYFARQVGQTMSTDATVIQERTREMADIEIPPQFTPTMSMAIQIPLAPKIMMAVYTPAGAEGQLMLMQLDMPMDQAQLNDEQQLEQMMRQSGQQGQQRDLEITETEARTFTINGQDVTFQFGKGTDQNSGDEFRQVVGAFPGKTGTVILMLQAEESAWDEAAVVQMLESLGEPVEPADAAMEAEPAADGQDAM